VAHEEDVAAAEDMGAGNPPAEQDLPAEDMAVDDPPVEEPHPEEGPGMEVGAGFIPVPLPNNVGPGFAPFRANNALPVANRQQVLDGLGNPARNTRSRGRPLVVMLPDSI
jgi:hypothetical protein